MMDNYMRSYMLAFAGLLTWITAYCQLLLIT